MSSYFVRRLVLFNVKKTLNIGNLYNKNISKSSILPNCLLIRNMSESGPSTSTGHNVNKKTNRLALEHSPYLRQHMYNPVDWYPWSDEAFDKAKNENKLIFLSVGYSTCHWCHVMEKESFENPSIALIMNEYFVNIKVDREERPDIDKIYMTFIQATTYRGGWPMSVFLTPDLSPVTGGTYFPPDDSKYQIGFKTLLLKIASTWRDKPEVIQKTGHTVLESLKSNIDSELVQKHGLDVPAGVDVIKKCFTQYANNFENDFGGWNEQPKFPQPSNFNFLFHVYVKHKNLEMGKLARQMCLKTLTKMANGGIYDHIGDGFARYSTDRKWHVPHFEKMLYDQGQLVVSYCDAYLVTNDNFFADVARGILTYVSRDLSHPLGGFYSAEDADSYPNHEAKTKVEGAFYVLEYNEIKTMLGEKRFNEHSYADIFSHHYDIKPDGNVDRLQDIHGELTNKNVPIVFGSKQETAEFFNMNVNDLQQVLHDSKAILYEYRCKRPRPHLDSKIITAWNGLMISGYCKAGFILNDSEYINRAILAANFIKWYLFDNKINKLLRSCYVGDDNEIVQISCPINGFLEDYAFLIRGLIDLYECTLDVDWLLWAEKLQKQQDCLFWDDDNGGYFQSAAGASNVILRLKEDQDGAEPNGNSVSTQNLIRLSAYLNKDDLKTKAGEIFTSFSDRLLRIPISLPEMASALISYHDSLTQIFIAGDHSNPNTEALLNVIRERLIPNRIIAINDGKTKNELHKRLKVFDELQLVHGQPAAYVCRNRVCSLPVTIPSELANLLDNDE